MQIAWAAPSVKSVTMLERVQHLIIPMVRYHFNDIVAWGRGYRGYRRTVANIAEASWHWQVDVPCPIGGNDEGRLPIRCRGGVFQGDAVEIGEGTGSAERQRNHIQECGSEEEIHDHATEEAEQNEVEESEEGTEEDNIMAAVEIRKSGDESTDSMDEDTSEEEEDTSEDEETSEEDDDGDGEEPSGINLHSQSTHRTGGASTNASNGSYRPGRPSGPRQSSEEPATTTEGQGQEQEHDSTQGGEAEERDNQTLEMNMEQVFGAEDEEPRSSPGRNTVHLS
jgi:hypothetical protein